MKDASTEKPGLKLLMPSCSEGALELRRVRRRGAGVRVGVKLGVTAADTLGEIVTEGVLLAVVVGVEV